MSVRSHTRVPVCVNAGKHAAQVSNVLMTHMIINVKATLTKLCGSYSAHSTVTDSTLVRPHFDLQDRSFMLTQSPVLSSVAFSTASRTCPSTGSPFTGRGTGQRREAGQPMQSRVTQAGGPLHSTAPVPGTCAALHWRASLCVDRGQGEGAGAALHSVADRRHQRKDWANGVVLLRAFTHHVLIATISQCKNEIKNMI